jgi:DNA-binding IscR family transcriptional regulator
MNEVIGVLVKADLIGAVGTEGSEGYVLQQAPEHVTAKKIYDLMVTEGSSPQELGLREDLIADEVLNTADRCLDETLAPITLRKLAQSNEAEGKV